MRAAGDGTNERNALAMPVKMKAGCTRRKITHSELWLGTQNSPAVYVILNGTLGTLGLDCQVTTDFLISALKPLFETGRQGMYNIHYAPFCAKLVLVCFLVQPESWGMKCVWIPLHTFLPVAPVSIEPLHETSAHRQGSRSETETLVENS